MADTAAKITAAVEVFLNDRKGFHVDDLDDDIREEFLSDLREIITAVLEKESRNG